MADGVDALDGARALREHLAREQRNGVAALLRLQAQHLVGRRAAGDGQIEETGDGCPFVGDEQQDQRRNENADQGPNLYFKP